MALRPTVASSGAGTLSRSPWPRAAACSGTHAISHAVNTNIITPLTEAQQESKVVLFVCFYSELSAKHLRSKGRSGSAAVLHRCVAWPC